MAFETEASGRSAGTQLEVADDAARALRRGRRDESDEEDRRRDSRSASAAPPLGSGAPPRRGFRAGDSHRAECETGSRALPSSKEVMSSPANASPAEVPAALVASIEISLSHEPSAHRFPLRHREARLSRVPVWRLPWLYRLCSQQKTLPNVNTLVCVCQDTHVVLVRKCPVCREFRARKSALLASSGMYDDRIGVGPIRQEIFGPLSASLLVPRLE